MHFGPPDPIILVQGSGRIAKGGGTGHWKHRDAFFFGPWLGEASNYCQLLYRILTHSHMGVGFTLW